MPVSGPKNGTAANSFGFRFWTQEAWQSPSSALASGGNTAYVTAPTFDAGLRTQVLRITGFDFSEIPDNATIDGVVAAVRARYAVTTVSIDQVGLLQWSTSAPVGINKGSPPTALTTSLATYTFGSSTDLWSCALTPAWVKDPYFGVCVGCIAGGSGNTNNDVHIDHVQLTVYWHQDGTIEPSVPVVTASVTNPTYSADATIVVTGVEITYGIGQVGAAYSAEATGVEATASVGAASVDQEEFIEGVTATGSVGTATATGLGTIAVTGIEATAGVGTVATEGTTIIAVSGVTVTTSVGQAAVSWPLYNRFFTTLYYYPIITQVKAEVTGVEATAAVTTASAVGTVSPFATPEGVSATSGIGVIETGATAGPLFSYFINHLYHFVVGTSTVATITGVEATSELGTVTYSTGVNVEVTGQEATSTVGNVFANGGEALITGVAATANVGTVTAVAGIGVLVSRFVSGVYGYTVPYGYAGEATATGVDATCSAGPITSLSVSAAPRGVRADAEAWTSRSALLCNFLYSIPSCSLRTLSAQPDGVYATAALGVVETPVGSAIAHIHVSYPGVYTDTDYDGLKTGTEADGFYAPVDFVDQGPEAFSYIGTVSAQGLSAGGNVTVSVSGVESTVDIGTDSTYSMSSVPISAVATATVGEILSPYNIDVEGQEVTADVGTVAATGSTPIVYAEPAGVEATGEVGVAEAIGLAEGEAYPFNLVAVVASVGTVEVSTSSNIEVTGVEATSAQEDILTNVYIFPSGLSATSDVGRLIMSANATTYHLGLGATGSVGTVRAFEGWNAPDLYVDGVESTVGIGAVTAASLIQVQGVSATTAIGTVRTSHWELIHEEVEDPIHGWARSAAGVTAWSRVSAVTDIWTRKGRAA